MDRFDSQEDAELTSEMIARDIVYSPLSPKEKVEQVKRLIRKQQPWIPEGWIYEDQLPEDYDYDANFKHSKIIDGVRMFPR